MAVTENSYTGNGSTTNYSFTFPYLKSTDVQVQVDATVTTAWQFANATTVQFNTAPANGAKIKILRDTNVDSLAATFYAGSSIKSEDLNDNYTQNLYKTQEVGARYFSTTGGTMTGDLTLGEDVTLTFEGATDNAHETKLTVADPTADRTITFPDTTGTVITTGDTGTVATGMIAADAVNGTKIADDSINSEHYVDGSIDTQHIADSQITTAKIADNNVTTAKIVDANITTAKIAADAVNGTKIADDSINSEHYVDGSIDTQHIADNQITTAKLVDNNVTADKLAHTSVTAGSYSAADITVDAQGRLTAASSGAIATSEITDGAVTTAKLGADSVTGAKIADDQINSEHYVAGSIDHEHLANDIIDGDNIQNDVINSEHYVAGSIDTEHIADSQVTTAKLADSNVTTAKIAANAVTSAKIADDAVGSTELGDGVIDTVHVGAAQITTAKIADSNVTTAKITDANVTTAKIADDAITIGKLGCEQTTISDSDSHIPTSGAVVDYVAAQIAPLGGLEVIATEVAFPNTQPASGVVISISDAGGVVVNGSGTSTTGRTVGGSTVTINGFPASLQSKTMAADIGLMVSSTGSSQTYNYHKILAKEADVEQLSNDINDFASRYRVGSSNPTSSLDNGDLFFNTGTGKMLVYNGTNTAWEEVQSIGNFFISTFSEAFDGSRTQFTLSNAPTNVQQVLLSLNGVVQKPGTAFTLSGSTVTLASAPASGTDYFAVVMGSTVNIGTPSNNTVSTAILQDDSVTTAKIAASNVTATELGANAVITSKIADDAVTTAKIADDAVTGDKIATNLDLPDNNKIRFGTGNDLQIYHNSSDGNSYIKESSSGSGCLAIDTDCFRVKNAAHSENLIAADQNSSVQLFYDNVKKFETTSAGVSVTGSVSSSGNISLLDTSALQLGTSNDFTLTHNGTNSVIDNNTGDLIIRGDGDDVKILAEDDIFLRDNDDTTNFIHCINGGAVELYHNGSKKFETTSNGADITGGLNINGGTINNTNDAVLYVDKTNNNDWAAKIKTNSGSSTDYGLRIEGNTGASNLLTVSTNTDVFKISGSGAVTATSYLGNAITCNGELDLTGHLDLNSDSSRIKLGAGDDFQLYHDGSNNYITTNNGDIIMQTTGDDIQLLAQDDIILKVQGGVETAINCVGNGAVELYHDGGKKLETTSTGIQMEGNINVRDNHKVQLGNNQDLQIYHTGIFNLIHATNGYLQSRASAHYINDEASSINFIRCENSLVSLHYNGSKKFETALHGLTSSGHIYPSTDNSYDLGSTSLRWRDIYTNDLHLSNEGSSNDVDGSWGDWTIQEGESDLFLKNNRSGKKYKFNLTEVK